MLAVYGTREPFLIGLDLGQQNDYTAVALLQRIDQQPDPSKSFHSLLIVRHLERFPRGANYADMAGRIRDLARAPLIRCRSKLVIDATGVGTPVLDMLKHMHIGVEIVPVVITGGDTASEENGRHRVPKKDLVAAVSVLLQQGVLQIPKQLALAETLVDEMLNFRVRVSLEGSLSYEAWRSGDHDDLVLAVALACWQAQRAWKQLIVPGNHWWYPS